MTRIVAERKEVLHFVNKTKYVHNIAPIYILNKREDITKKVKNEFGNSSGM